MEDSIQTQIDDLARLAVGAEAGDLPALVQIGELAERLAGELRGAGLDAMAVLAAQVQSGLEGIVLRSVDRPETALREAHRAIDEMQRLCASAGSGGSAGTSSEAGVENGGVDHALLSAWISGADGALSDLEALLLVLERSPADPEPLAEIRRIVHTIKGECGVLALHGVQRLCHEAETLIDRCAERGEPPAIDLLLQVVDWLHEQVQSLAGGGSTNIACPEELLGKVVGAQGGSEPGQAPTAPSEPVPVRAEPADSDATGVSPPQPSEAPSAAQAPAEPTVGVSNADPLAYSVAAGAEDNLADFLCEAREHIAGAEEALLALEHDASNRELINTVFRAFHTIKGVAGFIHLTPIVRLAHLAEQLLDGARSGTLQLARAELDVILASCDMLLKLLGMVEGAGSPPRQDYEALLVSLERASAGGSQGDAGAPAPAAVPARVEPEPAEVAPAPAVHAEPADSAPAPAPSNAAAVPEAEKKSDDGSQANAKAHGNKRADQTVKVSTSRMDNLVTMVGELVIAQQMVVQGATTLGPDGQQLLRTLGHVQKIVRDLQETSMSLRMVSLKSTFQRMTRLVRDVSIKAGKQIVCETEGEDVELDRNVVEEITDPLVHMIRNSCDHGLESAADRVAAGKPVVGRVMLRAYHSGGSIVIEIGDDGRGLRRDKIIAKAKSKGLLAADADETSIPDSEVFALIFLPGFSTAEKVTDISGRGVGMDVVRRNIEALRGKIEIRSTPGQGTTFLLRLPLTMAIIDGMVVRVGEHRYVIPTLSIEHSFRPTGEELSTVVGRGELVNVRGKLLPIYRLGRVLGLEHGAGDLRSGLLVVVETGVTKSALLVDEILGQQQVVIKNLGAAGAGLKGVAGGAILGDGRVALILDVGSIVAQSARTCA